METLAIFLVLIGLFNLFAPRAAWFASIGWKIRNAEPSDAYLIMHRFGGGIACIVAIAIIIAGTGHKEISTKEINNGFSKNLSQLQAEQGITLTGFASDPQNGLFKIGIGIDSSKMTAVHLKEVVESYLKSVAAMTSEHDWKKLLKPYHVQIEEIGNNSSNGKLLADKPVGGIELIWKE
ncbi:hypothetical protein O9H85_13290 [Paenibacillus filicis]|uniref:DUF6199 domain-containing protein n=1 Tax=Paenibacillus gyeongsangnamensis TaxID=3388067 RepID=A0ABT4Q924_9BACL|nr:DUF6199 family natural product biosynthesis protein [Paenibacillus filicis]MCZ8513384.1 hypothetical protein [Paenibacillus filicis]